jgi:SAM-dependent methyltransferase
MDFVCNVCGGETFDCALKELPREARTCVHCGSSIRSRSVIHALSLALFGRSLSLPEFPADPSIVGLGLSDWVCYAKSLAEKFSYTNTFFHAEPFLDISAPITNAAETCDFLIASEVFEHVCPPVSRAFGGAFKLLKPGGNLVLTVPFSNAAETVEHYPELHDYKIVQFGNEHVLVNRTASGRFEIFEKPVFHGGPGTTLEMRIFSRDGLKRHLAAAGFENIRFLGKDAPQWGIVYNGPWSLPILAKRPLADVSP